MQIRHALESDHDGWLPLWKGYQQFCAADIPEGTSRLTWQRFHDPAEPMHCAVADIGGQLVGMVHYIEHRSCWTTGDYVYLQDLFVSPDQRGRGIGKALIQHVYAFAQEAGASRVWWLTQETNAQARVLYDQVADLTGFIQYRKQC